MNVLREICCRGGGRQIDNSAPIYWLVRYRAVSLGYRIARIKLVKTLRLVATP